MKYCATLLLLVVGLANVTTAAPYAATISTFLKHLLGSKPIALAFFRNPLILAGPAL